MELSSRGTRIDPNIGETRKHSYAVLALVVQSPW